MLIKCPTAKYSEFELINCINTLKVIESKIIQMVSYEFPKDGVVFENKMKSLK